MESFKSKYPAFVSLLALVSALAQDLSAQGESMVQKLEGSISLVPQALAFIPQASLLSAEVDALKASPADLEGGVELLITDLSFSSEKAKGIVSAAFPLAESLVSLVPQAQALVAAIKA